MSNEHGADFGVMLRALLVAVGAGLLLLGLFAPGGTFMMAAGTTMLICASPWFSACVRFMRWRFTLVDKLMRAMTRVAGRRVGGILDSTAPGDERDDESTAFRACNLCEAICGLEIRHDSEHAISIKGDASDPLSQGHICPKALGLKDIHEDPSRLRRPLKKVGDGWQEISWETALGEVAGRTRGLRDRFGSGALAVYLGNPTVHNYGAMLFQRPFVRALGRPQVFSATSVDQLPHHFAASFMFGHSLLLPVPDVDRTDFMLILGANPLASNGSLMTAPGIRKRLKAIQDRGGRVVLIDPRRTETAAIADEHHFIRPGTDVWLLASLLQVISRKGLHDSDRLSGWLRNHDELLALMEGITPEIAAERTGIEADAIRDLAQRFAASPTAVAYGRFGVSTQRDGGLCHWLINALNIATGNFDRAGGAMLASPAVSVVGRNSTMADFGRWHSRVRGAPEFEGQLPVAVLAEEILTPGEGRIRALFTQAGNPVLSTPNGKQLEQGLDSLDLMVSFDIYLNETTRHADYILPPTTGLETEHYDLAFHALAVRNTAKFSPALFTAASGARHDWQILGELTRRIQPKGGGLEGWGARATAAAMRWLTPRGIVNLGLKLGPYGAWRSPAGWLRGLTLPRLRRSPHGVDLGPLEPQTPRCLRTPDKKIDLAPRLLRERLAEVVAAAAGEEASRHGDSLMLIGRRDLRSNNSWMHNVPRLIKGKERATVMMHPDDAASRHLVDGRATRVSSGVGEIDLVLQVSDEVMPGVVSIPHGFGHDRPGTRIPVAEQHAGASVNDVTDDQVIDPLTGTAAFSGQLVTVAAVPAAGGGE